VNKKLIAKEVSSESLHNDDIKIKYYTGSLPSYEILEAVFEFVTAGLPDNIFDQFLMVLMRI